jgi:glutaredoxin-dependent peroxiredoxin
MSNNNSFIVDNFTLQDSEGKPVSLKDLFVSGDKVVILFFPLAFSGVCTEELCQARDNMKMFNSLNTNVAAISIDSFFVLKEFKKANNLNFPLLSDFNKEVSEQFGVLYQDYFGMKGVSKRSVFVIDKGLRVIHSEVLEDSDLMPDFKAIMSALRSSND